MLGLPGRQPFNPPQNTSRRAAACWAFPSACMGRAPRGRRGVARVLGSRRRGPGERTLRPAEVPGKAARGQPMAAGGGARAVHEALHVRGCGGAGRDTGRGGRAGPRAPDSVPGRGTATPDPARAPPPPPPLRGWLRAGPRKAVSGGPVIPALPDKTLAWSGAGVREARGEPECGSRLPAPAEVACDLG